MTYLLAGIHWLDATISSLEESIELLASTICSCLLALSDQQSDVLSKIEDYGKELRNNQQSFLLREDQSSYGYKIKNSPQQYDSMEIEQPTSTVSFSAYGHKLMSTNTDGVLEIWEQEKEIDASLSNKLEQNIDFLKKEALIHRKKGMLNELQINLGKQAILLKVSGNLMGILYMPVNK